MSLFTSLGHIALRVKDIDRSVDFYTQKLRFPEMLRLFYDDGSLFLIYLRITDDQYLELFPYGAGDRAPGRDATAINHFCLTVENLDTVVADLVSSGVSITREIRTGPDGNRQAWIEDPDGNRIEMMEMSPAALQFQALRGLRAGEGSIVQKTSTPRPVTFA